MGRNIIWAASGLKKGDRIVANIELQSGKKPEYIEFLEDLTCGILVNVVYQEGTERQYKTTLNWASIYCGHIRAYKEDGTPIKAENLSIPFRIGNDMKAYPLTQKDKVKIAS